MWAVPSSVVFCTVLKCIRGEICFRFSSSLLLTVPNAPITTGIVRIFFKFQHFCSSISRSLYLMIFSASFLVILAQLGTAISMSRHSFEVVLCIIMSGLLCLIFLWVMIDLSHRIV